MRGKALYKEQTIIKCDGCGKNLNIHQQEYFTFCKTKYVNPGYASDGICLSNNGDILYEFCSPECAMCYLSSECYT
jgi:endogenous inhibitor of DNA gyrase (YacG/DUF329 family)